MNVIHAACMLVFLVVLAITGLIISKKVKTADDWSVAGRSLGIIPSTGTYFATIVSATSIISYVGYYYNLGWGGWWNWAGTALTTFLAASFFAAKLRRIGKTTLPDYLEERFGRVQGTLGACLILFATIFLTCAQIIGGSVLLSTATGWSTAVCTLVMSVMFIAFTVFGGMIAVAWTDTICSVIIIVGIWLMAAILVKDVGGLSQLHITLAETAPTMLDPWAGGKMPLALALSWIATWGLGNFGAPQFITRFYSAKSERVARLSQGFCGLSLLAFYIPLMLVGLSGSILMPGIERQDQVNPLLIANRLPPLLGGIMMAAILAACISTADSVLLLAATTATNDIYKKYIKPTATSAEVLKASRQVTLIIGVLAVLATLVVKDAVMWIQASMVTIMGSAMSTSVLIGLTWKRANAKGGLAGMLVGFATGCIWYMIGQPFNLMPILPAITASAVTMIVVSLMTEPPPQEMIDRFFPPKGHTKKIEG